jgi:GNAT superfamily N-acetyltransferase
MDRLEAEQIIGRIRAAQLRDIAAMQAIERAAGRLFAGIGMEGVAAHPPPDREILTAYVRNGRAWVAELDGRPRGYAIADIVDGQGHLEQVSVHPDYGRRGLGRALIGAVREWARAAGFSALTLLTFRDVPWNGPYYAAIGFHEIPDAELAPELRALREHERDLGLDRESRCAMVLQLMTDDRRTSKA